jgi:hypothetical protein
MERYPIRTALRRSRWRPAAGALTVLLVALAGMAGWRTTSHLQFRSDAAALGGQWNRDQRAGVPATRLAPLRAELSRLDADQAGWWWHPWPGGPGPGEATARLRAATTLVWDAVMSEARSRAQAALAASSAVERHAGSGSGAA